MTFVTGAHAFKFGFNDTFGGRYATYSSPGLVGLATPNRTDIEMASRLPDLITEYTTPYSDAELSTQTWACTTQDKWTLRRLTINAGVPVDAFQQLFP